MRLPDDAPLIRASAPVREQTPRATLILSGEALRRERTGFMGQIVPPGTKMSQYLLQLRVKRQVLAMKKANSPDAPKPRTKYLPSCFVTGEAPFGCKAAK